MYGIVRLYNLFLSGGNFGGVVKRNILFSRLVGVHRISCVGVRYLRVKEGTSGQEHSAHARRTWRSINILYVHRDDFLCVESQLKECRHRPLSFAGGMTQN